MLLAGLPAEERAAVLERTEPWRFSAHTVTGRRALARLFEDVARQGHALVEQEQEEGLGSLAVPVRDASVQSRTEWDPRADGGAVEGGHTGTYRFGHGCRTEPHHRLQQ